MSLHNKLRPPYRGGGRSARVLRLHADSRWLARRQELCRTESQGLRPLDPFPVLHIGVVRGQDVLELLMQLLTHRGRLRKCVFVVCKPRQTIRSQT